MQGMAFGGMDPHYNFWHTHYSWWYHAGHNNIQLAAQEIKNARISYGLGSLLAKDRLSHESVEKLKQVKIKVFDYGLDGEIAALLETLTGKVELVKSPEVPLHLLQMKIPPKEYIIVVSGLSVPQPKEIYQALVTFVNDGGRLFWYNCATHILGGIFLGKIQPIPPSTTVRAKLKVLAEKDLFTAFRSNEEINLEYHRYPIDILDTKNVVVLCKVQGQKPRTSLG